MKQSVGTEAILDLHRFLRSSETQEQIYSRSVPLEKGLEGYWLPLNPFLLENKSLILELQNLSQEVLEGNGSQNKLAGDEQLQWLLQERGGALIGKCQFELIGEGEIALTQVALQTESLEALGTLVEWYQRKNNWAKVTLGFEPKSASLWQRLGFRKNSTNQWQLMASDDFAPQGMILTAGPNVSAREIDYVTDATRYGWNSEHSKYLAKFEKSFASYLGVRHTLATSSCTGALHLAFLALGIGPGDEVLVPELTWVATASAVKYVGAKPVFVDIDPLNWCMDPKKIEAKISSRTKCIVPVHLYGHPCDMDAIMEIAQRRGLRVVEDAAPAIGAECRGRKVGTYGDFAAFSFQGAKLLVTGEGGMLVAKDEVLLKKAYKIWDHGRTPGTFWIDELGYKYKMSNMQAAFGLGQLEHVEPQILAKRQISEWYWQELHDFKNVQLHRESSWAKSIYWMSSLTIAPGAKLKRDALFSQLKEHRIDTRPTFPAISQYPMWKDAAPGDIAQAVGERGVNLPSGVQLTEAEVRYVARKIKSALA